MVKEAPVFNASVVREHPHQRPLNAVTVHLVGRLFVASTLPQRPQVLNSQLSLNAESPSTTSQLYVNSSEFTLCIYRR